MAYLVADARALEAGQYQHIMIYGLNAISDGGGGFYLWNASATNVDDGAAWIKPNSITHPDPGRWQRVWAFHPIVSLAGTPGYITIDSETQVITRALVDLAAHVTGNLPAGNLGSGTGATAQTVLHGDMSWDVPGERAIVTETGPTDYTITESGTLNTNNGQIRTGWRKLTAASETPGAFTFSASTTWSATTIAVRGTG